MYRDCNGGLKGWKYLAIERIVLQLSVKWVGSVLQWVLYFRDCWMCVAIQILYCRQLAGKAVSRYKICIVTEVFSLAGIRLQYKILYCG